MSAPVIVTLPVGDDPPTSRLFYGRDVREVLRELPEESVQCVVTSPPYWGLRDYGTDHSVWGGDPTCTHEWGDEIPGSNRGGSGTPTDKNNRGEGYGRDAPKGCYCTLCGAWRGELGQEPTPHEFVDHLVEVFREVRRVLRSDGILWLNLGDTFNSGSSGSVVGSTLQGGKSNQNQSNRQGRAVVPSLKPKDLVGIPWRVALALQDDGWWLRNDIIWAKKNRMPSPVQDRMTCAHEHIFLMAKSDRYFFDLDAIRVPHTFGSYDDEGNFTPGQRWLSETGDRTDRKLDMTEGQLGTMAGPPRRFGRGLYNAGGKNPGDVWSMATQPFPGAHFAVFPPTLPERCIKAGTPEYGCCGECGAPWQRVKQYGERPDDGASNGIAPELRSGGTRQRDHSGRGGNVLAARPVLDEWWEPSCACGEGAPLHRSVVLDPFSGSGTTGMAAMDLGRDYIGIDRNDKYLGMAAARVIGDKPPEPEPEPEPGSVLDIFAE